MQNRNLSFIIRPFCDLKQKNPSNRLTQKSSPNCIHSILRKHKTIYDENLFQHHNWLVI